MFCFVSIQILKLFVLVLGLIYKTKNCSNSLIKKKKKATQLEKWTEDLNRHSSKEDTQMANRHVKRCSVLLVIREMQTETAVRHHSTAARMAIITELTDSRSQVGRGAKGARVHCWQDGKLAPCCGEQCRGSFKSYKHMIQKSHSWAYIRRKL